MAEEGGLEIGKRSDFKRVERDFYRTIDKREIGALMPFLDPFTRYSEPTCGVGDIVIQLAEKQMICTHANDIEWGKDALKLTREELNNPDCIITNPPWDRKILHAMIDHFVSIAPYVWLLFDADWKQTGQSSRLMKDYCTDVVAVGRLIWIPGTKMSGKDNCAWYRFSKHKSHPTIFHGR